MVPLEETAKPETPLDIETHESKETSRNGASEPQPDQDNNHSLVKSERTELVPNSLADASRSNQGVKASPKRPKKGLQVPEAGALALPYGHEVSTPTSIREKVSEDGYNWRKYGQKLVKGNEYVRSYYRCTHPNCPVKKQLERLHEGTIVDIVYFGQHSHSKPQVNIPVAVGFAVSIVEGRKEPSSVTAEDNVFDEQSSPPPPETKRVDIPQISNVSANESSKGEVVQSSKTKEVIFRDDYPDSKRPKKDKYVLKNAAAEKPTSESRLVVQTQSEVDIVNDGYRWRKYGQKLVKGNPNPRSYYRCSNSGCPVKKHVERASHDPKLVITTYEGEHSHNVPPARIVSHNNTLVSSTTSPATQSDGNVACLDMVVDAILEHESRTEQQSSHGLPSISAVTDNECSKIIESSLEPESKPNKQQNSNFAAKEESDRTSYNLDVQPSNKSEGSNSCVVDMVIHDNVKTEVQNPDSKPVQG